MRRNTLRKILVIAVVLITIASTHLLMLGSLPMGLYFDETSIGYNAALIAQSGLDEHGEAWPIYFKAFGEYKNPIYIYTSAFIFKLLGVSEFNLRLTSFLFFFLALSLFILLIYSLFPKDHQEYIFALIAFGFLPQFFVLSRISFEVISHLSWTVASVYLVWITFESECNDKMRIVFAAACGLVIGSSVYTYSTARLLSGLFCTSIAFAYLNKKNIRALVIAAASCLVALMPYLVFASKHPNALTGRFLQISYIAQPIPVLKKFFMFPRYYFEYWLPGFLFQHGDANLRHSIGFGGIVFVIVWLMAILGLVTALFNSQSHSRFNRFLIFNTISAPIGAALTTQGAPHALRSLLVGFYLVLWACYGYKYLRSITDRRAAQILSTLTTMVLIFEASCYIFVYFVSYPARSIQATQSYDTKILLQRAIDSGANRVFFFNQPKFSYTNIRFYEQIVENPQQIPIVIASRLDPAVGDCIIYHRWSETDIARIPGAKTVIQNQFAPNWLARQLGVPAMMHAASMRCY